MAEIEITLPTVQYGNVKVRVTPEEFGLQYGVDNPYALGMGAATYLNLFTQGFKTGSALDVTASPTEGLSAPVSASQPVSEEQAQRYLDEGLGGVTELPEDGPDGVGVDGDGAAPWNKPQVDSKPKPWETGATAPAAKPVVDEDW